MPSLRLIVHILFAQLILSPVAVAQQKVGQFKGEIVAKFLRDGRNMRLEAPFGYIDPMGRSWDVPVGAETDGASIPRVLWVTHPPFTGKYRAAAVVHDYYCQTKSRDWKATHEVFYHAMRAAGVDDKTAKVMYAAVYYFGPRWGRGGRGEARATGAEQELPFEDQARLFEQIRSWIESESPDLAGIARRIDAGNLLVTPDEARMALVIGNSAYRHAPALENPKNDATDMAAALEKLGFKVIVGIDLDKSGMERTIRAFAKALNSSKVGLFFYAGHGLQVNGRNYLVPVDAKLGDASGLDFELIPLDLVQRTMERETKTNIVFLDACRDNPLARNLARSMGTRSSEIGRGLAAVESGVGTLISFSTQPGNVALDGTGRNSPFAGALVQQLLAGRGDLADMLISVRRSVMQQTGNRQVPWEHSSLTDRFYFTPPSAAASGAGLSYAEQAELAFWNAVKDSKQPAVVRSYLEAYPKGAFVVLAKAIIDQLENAQAAPPVMKGSGLYDGDWQVSLTNNQQCPKRTHTFRIRIDNSAIYGPPLVQPGSVDQDGNFRFKTFGAVGQGSLLEYSGKLTGESLQGKHRMLGGLC
ncbi:MAG TPA: caspase family protein, partial [Hyphomicrobiaceae bacterium]|nr:caspase family protein [Hyphomicrobiaceae bacterium]